MEETPNISTAGCPYCGGPLDGFTCASCGTICPRCGSPSRSLRSASPSSRPRSASVDGGNDPPALNVDAFLRPLLPSKILPVSAELMREAGRPRVKELSLPGRLRSLTGVNLEA